MAKAEEGMTKLGVDEDQNHKKEAATKGKIVHCPVCDREVVQHGVISVCPVHGTEPFERQKK